MIAEKDLDYDKFAATLVETRKIVDGVKRQNRREREKVNKLVEGSLVDNVQGLLDQSMKRLSSKKKTGTLLSAIKEGGMYGDLGVSALDDKFC